MNNTELKILIVCSKNSGSIAPFISEQVDALKNAGYLCDYYPIEQKGILGYLKSRKDYIRKIRDFKPDIVHAHFGLSGLFANLQRQIPVVTTFHGCDINKWKLRLLSFVPLFLSKHNLFVSKGLYNKVKIFAYKSSIIPCGVDFETFYPIDKMVARKQLGWSNDTKAILFSSNFIRPEKNSTLALDALKQIPDCKLIELKGYTRKEVNVLMNACDLGLLTSIREGSPMFIKELIACNRPIVSTNVGDVAELIGDIAACKIVKFDANDVADAIKAVMWHEKAVYPKELIESINNKNIVSKIILVYQSITKKLN